MIGVLDLNIGNINSVVNAVYEMGYDPLVVKNILQFDDITHLILPGVGSYKTAMKNFECSELKKNFFSYVESKRPVLGICLGMQILSSNGTEIKLTKGLDLISGSVDKFDNSIGLPIPHVGWNTVNFKVDHPVYHGIKPKVDFYFVHSYHYNCNDTENILATTDYGYHFTSAVYKDNIIGTQFHPEKSQSNGLKFLENFCEWNGK